MESNLALYRRYRPESFAEVIGQEHVTEPLRQALANDRVNHAYLFSGPRGCGKTTSARILARTLNCEKAPVSDPCGECQSCRDLARGGPGSIDVIEIDAASHGGVDDARDLRERAFFAPVNSRYKVYIIDEAHMVSSQGFNALLKLVEEPPEHLKFIFATTEPEKVIATIRSRTHHYPFRLFPPKLVADYIASLCEKEGVAVEPAVLPLVARAGAGSMRDSLSVMDQLLGGAGPDGVTYQVATSLLGYTPDNLLDEVVDALAASDGGTVFGVIDKVIESGQDPRRFTEDLLRRLRDLVIIAAVPDAPATGLIEAPADAAERLIAQAARFGKADLVRAADVVGAGLTEMRGATTPRLLLELICARVLLPGSDLDGVGLAARMDRLERRVGMGGSVPAASAPVEPQPVVEQQPVAEPQPVTEPQPVAEREPVVEPVETRTEPVVEPTPVVEPVVTPAAPQPVGAVGLADIRRVWPDVLERVKNARRFSWILLSQNAQVIGIEAETLTLGLKSAGARESFLGSGSETVLQQALGELLGSSWTIDTVVDPSADPGVGTAPQVRTPAVKPDEPDMPTPPTSTPAPSPSPAVPVDVAPAPAQAPPEVRDRIEPTRAPGSPPPTALDADADVDRDDPDADDSGVDGQTLLERELGATMIDEISHDTDGSNR